MIIADFATKAKAEQYLKEAEANGYNGYIVEWGTFDGFIYSVYLKPINR